MERFWRIFAVLGMLAVGGLLAVRFFVLHPYRIPSGGMSPTFEVGSHMIASHLDRDPERGKAIVFPYPEDPSKDFVQRIVAVGGDTISVTNGHPAINDWEVPNCRVGKYDRLSEGVVHHSEIFVEFLGKFTYLIAIEPEVDEAHGITRTWHVKPGYVFTMGDNRMNSYDSRMWPSQNGLDEDTIWGSITISATVPSLPADAKALQSALDDCLAKRPAKTTP